MSIQEILYGVLIVSVVVITVTIVWVANDLKGLLRSLRHSAEDTERVTHEIREKVMMLGEALDRASAAAASVIGLIESGIDQIKQRRDSIAEGIGLISGAGKAIKERKIDKEAEVVDDVKTKKKEEAVEKAKEDKEDKPEIKEDVKTEEKEKKSASKKENKEDEEEKPTVDSVTKA